MVSKSTIKLIKSLQQKKYRNKHQLFVVEGIKSVQEFLKSRFKLNAIYCLEELKNDFKNAEIVSEKELSQISALKNPQKVLAVFACEKNEFPTNLDELILALDNVQDPGNLGTILRLADWFGVKNIVCNSDTVDCYNPKTIQASMGSISRVRVFYTDLKEFLAQQKNPIYGTFINGKNIYNQNLAQKGIIILGNEGKGISHEIEKLCTQRISIPQVGNSTESLNVAMAASIVINEFCRPQLMKI
ncbi:RNA methyltransferase [Ornithobacterium rhinotracheale]|uniref:TrmH family RNA methyltransferase n=1 Tax=Ornithobacterium rhinotracheale TaxID=28251 RepID=UPI00129D21B9|nr:RNA methyltransferase [Ornithobacterium rhinotracheale]MRJ10756.1 RNA methyltransferase [Ornithobacterium rhinotracheale]